MRIRPARAGDRDAVYEVCLRTGDAEATPPGSSTVTCWATSGPGPTWRCVRTSRSSPRPPSGVEGYIVGAEDTAAFETECDARWWPARRARYADPPGDRELTFDEVLRRHVHRPPRAPLDVLVDHPAHLHVNLLPRLQGHGVGRRLLATLFDAMVGVEGIHLGVAPRNARAAAFYVHNGFVPVGRPRGPGEGWLLGDGSR